MHEFASCFCPYRLYPHDTLCTYGVKQLKLLGFSQRHLFWCRLMEQDTGVEPASSAWEADVLPMYESCVLILQAVLCTAIREYSGGRAASVMLRIFAVGKPLCFAQPPCSTAKCLHSNPPPRLGKPMYYRCTNPAFCLQRYSIIPRRKMQPFSVGKEKSADTDAGQGRRRKRPSAFCGKRTAACQIWSVSQRRMSSFPSSLRGKTRSPSISLFS